ncbi:MAG: presenilin family intramembrane aspartyl protease [Candidatus Woesearchaeota archaeon]
MKHDLPITLLLIFIFVVSQLVGLILINIDIKEVASINGSLTVVHSEPIIPRPETSGVESFFYLAIGIFIGTVIVLLLARFNKFRIWKYWFLIAVFLAVSIALGVFIPTVYAFVVGFILALWKILKPNIIIHNLTEVLMYAGIAVLIVPIFNMFWVFILLLAISIYDMFAVWQSKHMIKMATFQTNSKVFAGLLIPYKKVKDGLKIINMKKQSTELTSPISIKSSQKKPKIPTSSLISEEAPRNAILGGGDIAFPLIFSGVAMDHFVIRGMTPVGAFYHSLIIVVFSTIALAILFIYAKKDKFYPAMPFISMGCFFGYLVALLV